MGYNRSATESDFKQPADALETLLTIQQAITSRLDLNDVLLLIATAAQRLTSAQLGLLYVLENGELRIAAVSDPTRSAELVGYRIPVAGSAAGLSIQAKQLIIIDNVESDPRVYREAADRFGLRCYIAIPLIAGDRPIGVIAVADGSAQILGPESQRTLSMLATGAVIGLENARLYRQEQERRLEAERRHEVAEGLHNILASLNSNRSLDEILDYIASQASSRLLGCQAVAIFRFQAEANVLIIQAAQGLPVEFTTAAKFPPGHAAIGKTVVTRQPVVVADAVAALADEGSLKLTPSEQAVVAQLTTFFRAWLGVPLLVKGEVYGGILLYYHDPRTFSEEEINLAITFSDQVALAIENARLRVQAEQAAVMAERNRLARELHDAVTQTLFSASLIADVLPRLWQRNQAEGHRQLAELRQLTRGALAEMRTLLFELRPTAFIEAKLGELLKHLIEATIARVRIPISLTVQGDCSLPPEVQVALYRITQEGLNNITKHACCDQAEVRLRCQTGRVELTITDDGCGFDPASVSAVHLGLGIMAERAAAINATLQLKSEPDGGTRIELVWLDSSGRNDDE